MEPVIVIYLDSLGSRSRNTHHDGGLGIIAVRAACIGLAGKQGVSLGDGEGLAVG